AGSAGCGSARRPGGLSRPPPGLSVRLPPPASHAAGWGDSGPGGGDRGGGQRPTAPRYFQPAPPPRTARTNNVLVFRAAGEANAAPGRARGRPRGRARTDRAGRRRTPAGREKRSFVTPITPLP